MSDDELFPVRYKLGIWLATAASVLAIIGGFQLLRPRPPPQVAPERARARAVPSPPPPAAPALTEPPPRGAPAAAPATPTLPELARSGTPAGDPAGVERALAGRSAAALQLGGELARAGVEAPPELDELVRRHQGGESTAELRRFVVERFPPDLKLRALTLDWLERQPRP